MIYWTSLAAAFLLKRVQAQGDGYNYINESLVVCSKPDWFSLVKEIHELYFDYQASIPSCREYFEQLYDGSCDNLAPLGVECEKQMLEFYIQVNEQCVGEFEEFCGHDPGDLASVYNESYEEYYWGYDLNCEEERVQVFKERFQGLQISVGCSEKVPESDFGSLPPSIQDYIDHFNPDDIDASLHFEGQCAGYHLLGSNIHTVAQQREKQCSEFWTQLMEAIDAGEDSQCPPIEDGINCARSLLPWVKTQYEDCLVTNCIDVKAHVLKTWDYTDYLQYINEIFTCGDVYGAYIHRFEFVVYVEGFGCEVSECDMGLEVYGYIPPGCDIAAAPSPLGSKTAPIPELDSTQDIYLIEPSLSTEEPEPGFDMYNATDFEASGNTEDEDGISEGIETPEEESDDEIEDVDAEEEESVYDSLGSDADDMGQDSPISDGLRDISTVVAENSDGDIVDPDNFELVSRDDVQNSGSGVCYYLRSTKIYALALATLVGMVLVT